MMKDRMMVQIESKTTRNEETKGKGDGRERETQRRGVDVARSHTRAEENSLSVKTEKPLIQIPISPGRLVPGSAALEKVERGTIIGQKRKITGAVGT